MKDVCKYCGTTYEEVLDNGFVGCAHCYQEIEPLREAVSKMYGGKKTQGKNIEEVLWIITTVSL